MHGGHTYQENKFKYTVNKDMVQFDAGFNCEIQGIN